MVRIKHRYLLVQILYPNSTPVRSETTITPAEKSSQGHVDDRDPNDQPGPHRKSLLNAPTPLLAIHRPTPDAVTIPALLRILRASLSDLFGDYGAGVAGASLHIKYWSNATSTMILRCDRGGFRLVWAACTAISALPVAERGKGGSGQKVGTERINLPCVFQVLGASGTIRKCEDEAVRRATALVGRVKAVEAALEGGIGGRVGADDDDSVVQLGGVTSRNEAVDMGGGSDDDSDHEGDHSSDEVMEG